MAEAHKLSSPKDVQQSFASPRFAHHGALVDEGGGPAGHEDVGPHAVPEVLAVGGAEAPVADVAAAEGRGRESHTHLQDGSDEKRQNREKKEKRKIREPGG